MHYTTTFYLEHIHSCESQCSQLASKQSHTATRTLLSSSLYIYTVAKESRAKLWAREEQCTAVHYTTTFHLAHIHSCDAQWSQVAGNQSHTCTRTLLSPQFICNQMQKKAEPNLQQVLNYPLSCTTHPILIWQTYTAVKPSDLRWQAINPTHAPAHSWDLSLYVIRCKNKQNQICR